MRIALVVAALASSCAGADAQTYDDPAIAVCEYDFLEGKHPPSNYRRVNASISGDTATIEYEQAVLNVRPKKRSFRCKFELKESGYFLAPQWPAAAVACLERLPSLEEQALKHKLGSTERFKIGKQITACRNLLDRISKQETDRVAYLLPLVVADIYPIDPSETELSVD